VTPAGLWLRLTAGVSAAAGSILLIPVEPPAVLSVPAAPAVLVGVLGGVALFGSLARARPAVRRSLLTRRRINRSSFFLLWATVEEALWRRLVLGTLALHGGLVVALAASSIGFALSHRVGWTGHVVTGLGFGSVYLATGQLVAAIAMHAVYNLLLDEELEHSRAPAG
jgi:membrane protease YdiL (CAAX protease family)